MTHLSLHARFYVAAVIALGSLVAIFTLSLDALTRQDLVAFLILVVLALLTELYRSEAVSQVSHSAIAVLEFAALLLLPFKLFVGLVALSILFTWVRTRLRDRLGLYQWYKPLFNFAMTVLAAAAALGWVRWVLSIQVDPAVYNVRMGLGVVSAALVMVGVTHLLLAVVVLLVQGQKVTLPRLLWRDPNVILTDLCLSLLGYMLAILWTLNPWLTLLSLAPLYLVYRALQVPQLQQVARTDGKTGLLNAHHFMEQARLCFATQQRQQRPIALLMADLDLLREVNNRYGHLAGDVVLEGVGQVIHQTIREGDMAGRFGGEEFAILLPNTTLLEARSIASRLCRAVEKSTFAVETSATPIRVTVSIGVAGTSHGLGSFAELLHDADTAVYYAKEQGRNCVVISTEVPHSHHLVRSAIVPAHE